MSRALRLAASLLLLLFAGCAANRAAAPVTTPPAIASSGRTAVLLAINDVYRIEGVDGGTIGGMSRLRTLRKELEREHPDLIVLHAGDLLFPSFLSRTFNGEQMIDVLNTLDGDPAGFDQRMFAVFGNHEFEKDKMKDAPLLDQRVAESQFRWVNGNVVFAEGQDGRPLIAGDNLARSWIVESGGIRIGLFGLTVDVKRPEYAAQFQDPIDTARQLTAALRRQGAEVVVALTHLNASDDRRLLATLGADGPDLVMGGHDHQHMACDVDGRKVLKADADARTANIVRLTLGADGKLAVEDRLEPLDQNVAEDCAVNGTVQSWLSLHEGLFCGQEAGKNGTPLDPRCLEKELGSTKTPLVAEEIKIRGSETNLGDWIADRMVETFKSCGAQVAFINSGSLRLNQDLPAGPVTRRAIEELFAYPTPLYLLRFKGSTLQQVAARAIVGWPGSGNWLQISGFAFVHDTSKGHVSGVELVTSEGRRAVTPDEEILAVTNNYLFDPSGDRDGYTMLDPSMVVQECAANGKDLKADVVVPALQSASGGIDPRADGRIRQMPEKTETDPCAGPL
ncbi:MAG TPA: bifunctional metallophosphatase/5'-nucleotidase [Thermoanaerobaculia bacterium]|jgi:2',3'-cyclic-nucleotide 2'-phosphodiesterase (5'-nucleotidase family)|nr:bifunctional metallophosphatase/5'-nucleotidase [Thermoanaerobaculia bacterium]